MSIFQDTMLLHTVIHKCTQMKWKTNNTCLIAIHTITLALQEHFKKRQCSLKCNNTQTLEKYVTQQNVLEKGQLINTRI